MGPVCDRYRRGLPLLCVCTARRWGPRYVRRRSGAFGTGTHRNAPGQQRETGQQKESRQQGARNMTLDASMLRRCAEHCASFLEGSVDASWTVPIPDMTWNVSEAVAHMAGALLWYSSDFAAGPGELSSIEVKIDASSTNSELIR